MADNHTLTSDDVANDWREALEDLRDPTEASISSLVTIARENMEHANAIARTTIDLIKNVKTSQAKLNSFYVVDAIVKRIRSPYTMYFGHGLYNLFMGAYTTMDNRHRGLMNKLFETWIVPVPGAWTQELVFDPQYTKPIQEALHKWQAVLQQTSRPSSAIPSRPHQNRPQQQAYAQHEQGGYRNTPPPQNPVSRVQQYDQGRQPSPGAYGTPPPQQYQNYPSQQAQQYPSYQQAYPQQSYPQPTPTPPVPASSYYTNGAAAYAQPAYNNAPQYPAYPPQPAANSAYDRAATPALPAWLAALPPPPPPHQLQNSMAASAYSQPAYSQPPSWNPPALYQHATPVPEPAPTPTPAPAIDWASQLISILGPGAAAIPAAAPVPNNTELSLFNPESLKLARPQLLESLYGSKPDQCRQCGRRFSSSAEGKAAKSKHLDWHFKTNTRVADAQRDKGVINRSWFINEREWVNHREDDEGIPLQTTHLASSNNNNSLGSLHSGIKDYSAEVIPVPTDPVLAKQACPICQESFQSRYEGDQWVWGNARRVGGRIYHAECYDQAVGAQEREREVMGGVKRGSARNTPEPTGKRRRV